MALVVDDELIKALILKQACFSQFNDKEVSTLASLFHEKHFKAGDVIVKEGDPVDSIYLIVEGKADVRQKIVIDNKNVQVKSIATLKENEAIGLNETGFYSLSGIRTATVVAATDIVLLRLSVPAFHGFALSNSRVNSLMRQNTEKFLDIK